MSYSTLPGGAGFLDSNQLPAVLELFEGNIKDVYTDGSRNPTIGRGMNLDVSSNMAIVLYLITPSLFTNLTSGR